MLHRQTCPILFLVYLRFGKIGNTIKTITTYVPNLIVEIEEKHRNNSISETSNLLHQLGYKGLYIDIINESINPFDATYIKDIQNDYFNRIFPVCIKNLFL